MGSNRRWLLNQSTQCRVAWLNNHRLFGPIGHFPPAEAEANYYAAIDNLDMVASLK